MPECMGFSKPEPRHLQLKQQVPTVEVGFRSTALPCGNIALHGAGRQFQDVDYVRLWLQHPAMVELFGWSCLYCLSDGPGGQQRQSSAQSGN